jgi:hypothetical protein
MAANTPSEYCCHYAFIYIQFTFDSHLIHIRFSQFTVRIHRHPHNTPIPPMPPIPPIAILLLLWPRQPPRRTAERQPCRGANSLRPHPYGPHIFADCIAERQPTPVFWPEAIATSRPAHTLAGGHLSVSATRTRFGRRPSQLGGAAALT